MRTGLVSGKNGTEVALSYQLKGESDPAGIQTNRDKVKHLLEGVNFTLPSLDHLDAMYENGIFMTVLNNAIFRSVDAVGVVHNDLFSPITLPCMALAASAVERVLLSYKSGTQVPKDFSALEFTPIYFTHLATLAAIYNTPEAQGQLVKHLHQLGDQLRKPYLGAIQTTSLKHVRSRISPALIAARYRSEDSGASSSTPILNQNLPRLPSAPPPSHEALFNRVKTQLGPLVRSLSTRSTPESDVVDAIYSNAQGGTDAGADAENFGSLLAQVTGSSDSEVQAARAGALESNVAGKVMAEPPESDSSDADHDAPLPNPLQPRTLSDDESDEEADEETDGDEAVGLVGDTTMKTAAGSDEDSDSDDEEEDGGGKEMKEGWGEEDGEDYE
ncbi:hypothetical protein RSOLAG1IB_12555 [Rhizoctonia solani AG-1 IB]|nr:hypothetical protein RSOLAG1IB_12555 [Rhizoctonia solani AG-1 IB]